MPSASTTRWYCDGMLGFKLSLFSPTHDAAQTTYQKPAETESRKWLFIHSVVQVPLFMLQIRLGWACELLVKLPDGILHYVSLRNDRKDSLQRIRGSNHPTFEHNVSRPSSDIQLSSLTSTKIQPVLGTRGPGVPSPPLPQPLFSLTDRLETLIADSS